MADDTGSRCSAFIPAGAGMYVEPESSAVQKIKRLPWAIAEGVFVVARRSGYLRTQPYRAI